MRLPSPDPLTIVCLYVAAIFMALKEGVGKVPAMRGLDVALGGSWSYFPVAILSFAAAVYIYKNIIFKNTSNISTINIHHASSKISEEKLVEPQYSPKIKIIEKEIIKKEGRNFLAKNVTPEFIINSAKNHTEVQVKSATSV